MAGISDIFVGYNTKLYMGTKLTGTRDSAAIETFIGTASAQVTGATDLGFLTKERAVIDRSIFGADVIKKIPGAVDPGTFEFKFELDLDDTRHKAIRDDSATTEYTFAVVYKVGANQTAAVFDGYVAKADVTNGFEEVVSIESAVARTDAITWVDKA